MCVILGLSMQAVNNDNFGPLIAYLVPGATVLLGFSQFSPTLQGWFAITSTEAPTIGGFLYLTVSSIAVGMTVSAVRWAVVDTLHRLTGLPLPPLDFTRLGTNVAAFRLLIEIHYEHYQFYGNMCVATAVAYLCHRVHLGTMWPLGGIDVAFVALESVFLATSRDTLKKYYLRSQQLLAGSSPPWKQPTTTFSRLYVPDCSAFSSRRTNSGRVTPKAWHTVRNWITSRRRSPRSYLLTKD